MTILRLWDNYVGAPGTGTSGLTETIGSALEASAAGGVTFLRWRAGNTNTSDKPSSLDLWDGVSGAQLAHLTSIGHSGLAGWQEEAVIPAVPLTTNQRYVVSATYPSGNTYCYTSTDAAATSPLAWSTTPHVTDSAHGNNYPTNSTPTLAWWVDVTFDTTAGGGGGSPPALTVADVTTGADTALNSWLNVGGGDYPAISVPVIDHGLLTDGTNGLAAIRTQVDANGASITATAGDVAAVKAKVTSDGVTLDTKIGPVQTYFGVTGQGVSAGVELVSTHVASIETAVGTLPSSGVVATAGDLDALLQRLREQLTLTPDPATDPRWTLTSTTTGTGWAFIPDGADMYRLTITNPGSLQPHIALPGGVDWYPRIGWWAPVRDGFVGPRGFIEFGMADLRWPAQRMNGCLLYLGPGVDWSIDALVLDA